MATYQRSYTDPDSLPATWTSTSKSYTEIFATQEYALYGSSRLGIFHQTDSLRLIAFNSTGFDTDGPFLDKTSVDSLSQTAPSDSCGIAFSRGGKRYELSNHLGNVLAVISDRKLQVLDANMTLGHYFTADIWSASDYYPFGMTMGGRSWSQSSYRFGFQGQETEQEFYGGAVSYKYRVHDPRIGRFLSIDPLAPEYPFYSSYAFSGNRVIDAIELEGLEPSKEGIENGEQVLAKNLEDDLSYEWRWNQEKCTWENCGAAEFQLNQFDNRDNGAMSQKPIPGENERAMFLMSLYEETVILAGFRKEFFFFTQLKSTLDDNRLFDHFVDGDGSLLEFPIDSDMAEIIGNVSNFRNFANKFENAVLTHYRKNGELEGFDGNQFLKNNPTGYMGGKSLSRSKLFSWAVLGGYQQLGVEITNITDQEVTVQYTFLDYFGVGQDDSHTKYEGLRLMYHLQHYRSVEKEKYTPFEWTVTIQRKKMTNE
jgi:RHS repeat-associated protein